MPEPTLSKAAVLAELRETAHSARVGGWTALAARLDAIAAAVSVWCVYGSGHNWALVGIHNADENRQFWSCWQCGSEHAAAPEDTGWGPRPAHLPSGIQRREGQAT